MLNPDHAFKYILLKLGRLALPLQSNSNRGGGGRSHIPSNLSWPLLLICFRQTQSALCNAAYITIEFFSEPLPAAVVVLLQLWRR
jgi:hypothetical protein